MSPSIRSWVICVLAAALCGGASATFRVVPEQKPAAVRRDEAPAGKRTPAGTPAAASEARGREASGGPSQCTDALTSMSLGIDDPVARERLKNRRCD